MLGNGRRISIAAIVAAAALLAAPAAHATNGGTHGYLPEQKDWCLGVTAPQLTEVGTRHALLKIEYFDDCLFPAKSSIEIRSGDGGWREVESAFTKSSDRRTKKWDVRNIQLSDLNNNTRYHIRSRIDYTGDDAHTDELTFRTGGDPAREMRAQGTLTPRSHEQSIVLTAIVPDVGKVVPTASWQAPAGWERYSADEPWFDTKPYSGKKAHECSKFTDHYQKCFWRFTWQMSIGTPQPIPKYFWKDGIDYKVRFCIKNSVYDREFGVQCTKEFTAPAGKAATIDVGQSP